MNVALQFRFKGAHRKVAKNAKKLKDRNRQFLGVLRALGGESLFLAATTGRSRVASYPDRIARHNAMIIDNEIEIFKHDPAGYTRSRFRLDNGGKNACAAHQ